MKSHRYQKASSRIAKRERARRIFTLVLKIGIPTALLVGLVMLARADFLQVKSFEVEGEQAVSEENMKNVALGLASGTRFLLIPKSNIFLLDKDGLANALLSEFGRIKSIEVNKNFFSQTVKLGVEERQSDFLWCLSAPAGLADECFFMDKSGLVFERSLGSEDLIVFRGALDENPLMKNFASPDKMQNYLDLISSFEVAGLPVDSISVESDGKAVAQTDIGNVFFNSEESDISAITENVILLINEVKSKTPSARFDYIDARFGNKLFYKLK